MPETLFKELCTANLGDDCGSISYDCSKCKGERSKFDTILNKLDDIIKSNIELRAELQEEKQKRIKLEQDMETKIKEILNEEKEKES